MEHDEICLDATPRRCVVAAFVGGFVVWIATTHRTPIDATRIIVPYLVSVISFVILVLAAALAVFVPLFRARKGPGWALYCAGSAALVLLRSVGGIGSPALVARLPPLGRLVVGRPRRWSP